MSKDSLPTTKICEEHQLPAKLIGWDSDGIGIYECPQGHGLLENGDKISIDVARMFDKL